MRYAENQTGLRCRVCFQPIRKPHSLICGLRGKVKLKHCQPRTAQSEQGGTR